LKDAECVFCKIVAGEIPSPKVWQDDACIAIRDIAPQARVHFLVIPRDHYESIAHLPQGSPLFGRLLEAAVGVARQEGLVPGGFRTQINTGRDGGQTVFHTHLHVLKD